jgi:hypothetical protein
MKHKNLIKNIFEKGERMLDEKLEVCGRDHAIVVKVNLQVDNKWYWSQISRSVKYQVLT